MLKVGITGGIGSGKTIICKVFETLGIPVFYADEAAKKLMVSSPTLIKSICDTFGNESYFADGSLNRKYIANKVFKDETELDKLNKLVHPAVFHDFAQWQLSLPQTTPYALKEAALLFESQSYKLCDKSLLVTAPLHTKLQRVMHRDGLSEQQVLERMNKQMPDEEKQKLADFTIDNDENKSVVLQVLALHQQFLTLRFAAHHS